MAEYVRGIFLVGEAAVVRDVLDGLDEAARVDVRVWLDYARPSATQTSGAFQS